MRAINTLDAEEITVWSIRQQKARHCGTKGPGSVWMSWSNNKPIAR